MVAPAYMLAFRIFEDSALKLRAVPEVEEGIDIESRGREMKKSEERAQADGNNEPVSHAISNVNSVHHLPQIQYIPLPSSSAASSFSH